MFIRPQQLSKPFSKETGNEQQLALTEDLLMIAFCQLPLGLSDATNSLIWPRIGVHIAKGTSSHFSHTIVEDHFEQSRRV